LIQLEYLEVAYNRNRPVLTLESLRIERGERVAIIGPSGAGKSTLLRCLKGYVQPRRGKVEVLGVNLTCANRRSREEVKRRIGLIYQQFHLVRRLSVLENTLCGRLGQTSRWRSVFGRFSPDDIRAAWSAIVEVGLEEKVHQRVDTLSGGEQQRVAVARTVAQQAELILADEPVSSLDPTWAADVLELLTSVQSHHEATLVMTLHQPDLAKRFAQRIIGLRDGRIVWDGPPANLSEAALQTLYGNDRLETVPFRAGASA
jgi:phosphonate transport system ATP-binding protein